ncbi:MAG: TauD/TfdA family dioxygenase [Arenicellales bacterium]
MENHTEIAYAYKCAAFPYSEYNQEMVSGNLKVTRLAGALGAEVKGMPLADVDAAQVDIVKSLLLEHQVLFFPDQFLGVDAHVNLGRYFGILESHPNLNNPYTEHPEIFELAASHGGVADEWHSDISFQANPSIMSILNMIKCPDVGGDTLWSSTYAAYEGLSAPMKDLLDGLTALHDAAPHCKPDITAIHPVVRIHPETNRKAIFVNEHFTRRIVELSHQESRLLLEYLIGWIASPRFTVRYHWQQGAIAIWDNRCTQHYVLSDFDEERIIQRVTVMGDNPRPAGPPRWEPFTRTEVTGATSRFDQQLNKHLGREVNTLASNKK